jgi:hypothetical protein
VPAPAPAATVVAPRSRPPYEPLDRRLRLARGGLIAVAVLAVLGIVSDGFEIELLQRIQDGGVVSVAEADASDTRQQWLSWIRLAGYVVAGVLYIRWFHRAYRNLDVIGGHARYGSGWAIGGWFVPILGWWRPKQLANDLWDAGRAPGEPDTHPPLLQAWWALWLIGVWLGQIMGRRYASSDTLDEFITADWWSIATSVADVAGAVLAIAVARRITERLDATNARVNAPAGDAAPPTAPVAAAA